MMFKLLGSAATVAADFVGGLPTKLILLGIGLAAVAGAYFWIDHIVEQNGTLKANQAVYQGAMRLQEDTNKKAIARIDDFVVEQKKTQEELVRLTKASKDATEETRRLNDVFSKHDLGELAKAKPKLVEHTIDDGTARALRLLECATGGGHDCPAGAP